MWTVIVIEEASVEDAEIDAWLASLPLPEPLPFRPGQPTAETRARRALHLQERAAKDAAAIPPVKLP